MAGAPNAQPKIPLSEQSRHPAPTIPPDAAAESARRQEILVRRAKDHDPYDALCRTYRSVDELLALDFGAQWHPTAKELNDNDQDELMHNTCVKLGRLSRIESTAAWVRAIRKANGARS